MYSDKKIKNAIKNAIDNVLKEGITDVDLFNKPFELNLLNDQEIRTQLIDVIFKQIKSNNFENLKFHKNGTVLVPKRELCDFRKCALIDIVDEIKYLSLVFLIAPEIERNRIKKSSQKVFSYRFLPKNGYLFDMNYHFTAFREHVSYKTKLKRNNVLVECDISNFYDRLNLHRLESVLLSIDTIDTDIISLINELLLYWANRDSYGLPVGSNASRILAEASLIEVDNYLISKGVDFCRFVDDYRIFAENATIAQQHLSFLVNALNREGLFLNTGKTKLTDISKNKKKVQENTTEVTAKQTWNIENLPKIIRGYSGVFPSKFRKLTEKEKEVLAKKNLEEMLNNLKDEVLIDSKLFVEINKVIVSQNKFEVFPQVVTLLDKVPQFMPYIVDIILKYGDLFSEKTIIEVKEKLAEWFEMSDISEFILVYLVRAFNTGVIADKNILLNYFRNSKRVAGDYIGRALLESFDKKLSRGEVLEIRNYYTRADIWEKRQILKLVKNKLSSGEKRAYFKDIKIHNDDFFIPFIIDEKDRHRDLINKF